LQSQLILLVEKVAHAATMGTVERPGTREGNVTAFFSLALPARGEMFVRCAARDFLAENLAAKGAGCSTGLCYLLAPFFLDTPLQPHPKSQNQR